MLVPPYLVSGDTILIIATARARNKESIFPAIQILESWGLNVEVGKNAYKVHHQFAGTDEERAADLQWAIDHPVAKAVLFSGGGYGSLRIIDSVDFATIKTFPKFFIGYSDATIVHSRLLKTGLACIHGTMAFQFTRNSQATLSVRDLLMNNTVSYQIPLNQLNRKGKCSAEMVGGNLSIIYALNGSCDDMQTDGKILFIEDLDEQLYHIDRMILNLKRSGKLKLLAGLVVGGMSDMKDNAIPFGKTAEEIIMDAVQDYEYPVCFNFPAGHIEANMALYLGRTVTLEVTDDKTDLKYI